MADSPVSLSSYRVMNSEKCGLPISSSPSIAHLILQGTSPATFKNAFIAIKRETMFPLLSLAPWHRLCHPPQSPRTEDSSTVRPARPVARRNDCRRQASFYQFLTRVQRILTADPYSERTLLL